MIKRELAQMLHQDAQDPRFTLATITGVELSRDYSRAKVFIVLRQQEEGHDTLVALNKAAGFFRHRLATTVKLRSVPQLRFVYDDSFRQGHTISDIIDSEMREFDYDAEL